MFRALLCGFCGSFYQSEVALLGLIWASFFRGGGRLISKGFAVGPEDLVFNIIQGSLHPNPRPHQSSTPNPKPPTPLTLNPKPFGRSLPDLLADSFG